MYLNVFTVLVILSYQCLLTTCNTTLTTTPPEVPFVKETANPGDCKIHVSSSDYNLPIPFTYTFRSTIIHPDESGFITIERNKHIQLSCVGNTFKLYKISLEREITITCIRGDRFMHNGVVYKYHDFQCQNSPVSRMLITSFRCQNNASVAAVGFQARRKFFILYHVCYDLINKTPLYSWYFVQSPHKTNQQSYPPKPVFIKSKQFLNHVDVHKYYMSQKHMLLTTLGSKRQLKKFYDPSHFFFLTRTHLVSRSEFFYGFEQEATFYYENTIPTWQSFYKHLWSHVDAYIRVRLMNGASQHVVITGTYGVCTLPDVDNNDQPLYLNPPKQLPVPKFIWKLDYDLTGKHNPIVFIGLNYPFRFQDNRTSIYMCTPMPCPTVIQRIVDEAKNGYIYCCSKKAFENVYGQIQSIVFHRNLVH